MSYTYNPGQAITVFIQPSDLHIEGDYMFSFVAIDERRQRILDDQIDIRTVPADKQKIDLTGAGIAYYEIEVIKDHIAKVEHMKSNADLVFVLVSPNTMRFEAIKFFLSHLLIGFARNRMIIARHRTLVLDDNFEDVFDIEISDDFVNQKQYEIDHKNMLAKEATELKENQAKTEKKISRMDEKEFKEE